MNHDEPGYLPAIIGSVLGLAIGGLLFGCGSLAYFSYTLRGDPYALPGLGALVVGVPGAVLGQVLGCWFVLRRAAFDAAGATAAVLAVIVAISLYITVLIVSSSNDVGGVIVALFLWLLAAPALARAIVVGGRLP